MYLLKTGNWGLSQGFKQKIEPAKLRHCRLNGHLSKKRNPKEGFLTNNRNINKCGPDHLIT